MANRKPFSYPRFQAFDGNGDPLEGGTAEFFDAGTTNQRSVYSDPELTTTAPNPVTLNARGEPESGGGTPIDIYFDPVAYKIVLKDSDGVTVWTIDNYIQDDLSDIAEPKDAPDATDSGTDTFVGTLDRDPQSGERIFVDFQSTNNTTSPTFENTDGTLGALTIKTREGESLWFGALNGVHALYYDGTDYLVLDPDTEAGTERPDDPEHATDSGTDSFDSATNTSAPNDGEVILRDFQSANTTTTPTLDGTTITTKDGSALWAGALSGVHELQYDSSGPAWRVIDPNPVSTNDANATVKRDSNGRAQFADPSAAQDAATKNYADTGPLQKPGTPTAPGLSFDTWRTPDANRPVFVQVDATVQTDGTSSGQVVLEVDDSGGTTSDHSYTARIDPNTSGGNAGGRSELSSWIQAGGSYQVTNNSDPNNANQITVREYTP